MAGGKQSPRQKMVNLMYLVFISMLAMNMSKQVLAAFGVMNEKLEASNTRATDTNKAAYSSLATKAAEQAKQFGKAKEDTDKLREMADELVAYIADLKTQMTAEVSDALAKQEYQSLDKSGFLDQYFFAKGKTTEKAKEFVAKIEGFRNKSVEILAGRPLADVVKARFNTDDIKDDSGTQKWLNYNYEGFPLIASLTKLTQIQSDIKTTESDALSALLQGELSKAVSMTNYDAMVVFDKNAYYPGEKLSGKIVLGKNDPNLTAEKVIINDKEWPKDKIKAGQVILDGPAGSVGDKTLKGSFFFKENDSLVEIPINGGYSVIPKPNDAVISADKMNVVYKGLSNPLTISIPGVPSNKVSASAPGLRKKGGDKYMMNPKGSGEVTIRVSAVSNGVKINSSKKFRIKDIPAASASVRGRFFKTKMPKASLGNVTVGAGLPDFLFDLKLRVSGFTLKVPGVPAVVVKGTKMNGSAKKAIQKARRGGVVSIYDVKATVIGSSYRIKQVAPIAILISN